MIRVVGKSMLPELVFDDTPLSENERVAMLALFATHHRNLEWYQAHVDQLLEKHAGQFICVAGGEAFAASTAQEAFRMARAAHPEEANAIFGIRTRKANGGAP